VSFARQRWYEESTWDIIAFLDADTCMPRWWIQKVINAFQDKDVWFVSWPYSYYDVSHIAQIGSFFWWRTLWYIGYLMVGYLWVWGNFAIRRTVLDQMNWFDTSIVFYGDDTDAARRASQYSKSLFLLHLTMPTSARRFVWQGLFKTLYVYILNYWSQAIRHRSATTTCQHFR
jgi:GT2 family glycosyltransferase